jgi:hypothetical protein
VNDLQRVSGNFVEVGDGENLEHHDVPLRVLCRVANRTHHRAVRVLHHGHDKVIILSQTYSQYYTVIIISNVIV